MHGHVSSSTRGGVADEGALLLGVLEQEPGRRAVVWAVCRRQNIVWFCSRAVGLRYLYCIVFNIHALLLGAAF